MYREPSNRIIAIEEHYVDDFFLSEMPIYEKTSAVLLKKLSISSEERIAHMDAAGIDMQILSHNHPGAQVLDDEQILCKASVINNRLSDKISKFPERMGAFATLPMHFPQEAANELERCVKELGFVGAMIHGNLNGEFFDKKKYWPVFEMAVQINKPIYIHPGDPHPKVKEAYYNDYANDFPIINTAGWGFGVEASTAALRLILSGIFEKLPTLKIILGHMGEGIPFLLERCHASFSGRHIEGKPFIDFRSVFCENFFITTSGNFSNSALACSIMEMGADKILFAIDWPYNDSERGTKWIKNAPISAKERKKITCQNAIDLFYAD